MTGTCSTEGNLKHSILEHNVPEMSSDACLVPKRDQTASLFTEGKKKPSEAGYPLVSNQCLYAQRKETSPEHVGPLHCLLSIFSPLHCLDWVVQVLERI